MAIVIVKDESSYGDFLTKGISIPPPTPGFGTIESYLFTVWDWEGGGSTLGEAVAHAPPRRRGVRLTPWGYAPLESSGNGCLRQPMQTFFYCDPHEGQQRGKTPRVKIFVKNFKNHFRSIFLPFQAISSNFVFFHC